ncbi:MAG: DinB family protein [Thermomicrobiales bacterium]|nr:DinB family protein [Thermomicrobiales bacterium]
MGESNMLASLIRYHGTATQLLASLAVDLSEQDLDTPIEGYERSIRSTLQHLVEVDWAWRSAVETRTTPDWSAMAGPAGPAIADIAAAHAAGNERLLAWIAGATESDLNAGFDVHWPWMPEPNEVIPWRAISQIVLHGQQHRGELAVALTRLGRSPGNFDYIFVEAS